MPLARLNLEQRRAATAHFGQNLVIASAGTGKTSTIVGRIAHLIHTGIQPKEILLLTFTNKAAREMVERVGKDFGHEKALRIESGTFHAVSYRWQKRLGYEMTLKQPRELRTLFKSVYEKRRYPTIDSEVKPYASHYLYDLHTLHLNSSRCSFDSWMMEKHAEHAPYLDIYQDMFDEFSALKKKLGYGDYNDLLINMRTLLEHETMPFQEVLVDEYQDTNPLQHSLIESLNPPSLFCVGDYDQSIYAFNGADINLISTFQTRHPHANIFTLTKNYRSVRSILTLANTVIEKNERIYPKSLEVVRNQIDTSPKLLIYEDLFDQYQGIAAKIQISQRPPKHIAVIFRNNSSADGIEASLRELGIASKRRGGMSFFDSKEVRALLDICTIFANSKDMMAFIHVLAYGKGIGNAIAKDTYEALVLLGDGNILKGLCDPLDIRNPFPKQIQNIQLGLFDDFHELGSVTRFSQERFPERFLSNPILKHPKLTRDGARFLYAFYTLVTEINTTHPPFKILKHIAKSTLYQNIIEGLSTQRATQKDGTIHAQKKQESLERITRKVSLLHDLSSHYNDLQRFLNAMILGGSEMAEGEGVNLLSVHASKGLEFEEVYLIDLMDGRFPNRKLMRKTGSIEEERRLFYVAVTRAKDILYLSYARFDSIKNTHHIPSQFLREAGMIHENSSL
jgi:DNA helicase II / ATP-dependent DNA helicase PcrA